jgi:hypothetical protein
MKLGIIVPYRERESHLKKFTDAIKLYFKENKIDYELIIVEQIDDKPFNRGKLLNIGFIKAKELLCNYVVFHDIDMLPLEVDYSYSAVPLHLATNFELEYDKSKNLIFDDYFGGVTMFSVETFEKVNGYSNQYWGWGFEDDDLLFRTAEKKIALDTKIIGKTDIKNLYGLSFNGTDSYIKIPKKDLLDFEKDTSILITFKPVNIMAICFFIYLLYVYYYILYSFDYEKILNSFNGKVDETIGKEHANGDYSIIHTYYNSKGCQIIWDRVELVKYWYLLGRYNDAYYTLVPNTE